MTSLRFLVTWARSWAIFARGLPARNPAGRSLILIEGILKKSWASDFGRFYASARFFWAGKDIYRPVPIDW